MRKAYVAALVALLGSASAAHEENDAPRMPGWMTGCWEMRVGERWAEECWTIPRKGMMMGSGRMGNASEVTSWENMRIVRLTPDGKGSATRMVFSASPLGEGWTAFEWSASEQDGVTFLNPAHDYPQRIRYWREGKKLMAETSLLDGSQRNSFAYDLMGG